MAVEAFPLHWPAGFPRSLFRKDSRFKSPSLACARDGLLEELRRMRASEIVLSTNVPLRNDGLPIADYKRRIIIDTGVAVYFRLKGQRRSLACDRWDRVEDNMHALKLTIEAMRGLERWGASDMLDRVFTGFAQIEAPPATDLWAALDVRPGCPTDELKRAFRQFALKHHPDGSQPDSNLFVTVKGEYDTELGRRTAVH